MINEHLLWHKCVCGAHICKHDVVCCCTCTDYKITCNEKCVLSTLIAWLIYLMSVWVCWLVNVWVFSLVNVWLCSFVNVWLCALVNVWLCSWFNVLLCSLVHVCLLSWVSEWCGCELVERLCRFVIIRSDYLLALFLFLVLI